MIFQYLSQTISLTEEETSRLRAFNIPYVDKPINEMTYVDLVYNLQMLQKLTNEKNAADEAIADNAALKARILELESEVVKYQKLYFAISRPS